MKEKIKSAIIAVVKVLVISFVFIAIAVQFMSPIEAESLINSNIIAYFFGGGMAVLFFMCFVYVFSHIE